MSVDEILHHGYSLSTEEVVLTTAYWTHLILHGKLGKIHAENPDGGQVLVDWIERQASQYTRWAVCEECSKLFHFNHAKARKLALQGLNQPECGPVSPYKAARYAAKAWKKVFGMEPSLTKFHDGIILTDIDTEERRVYTFKKDTTNKAQAKKRKWWQL